MVVYRTGKRTQNTTIYLKMTVSREGWACVQPSDGATPLIRVGGATAAFVIVKRYFTLTNAAGLHLSTHAHPASIGNAPCIDDVCVVCFLLI